MDRLVIRGGTPLQGKIEISGAKNAALPLMVTSLLTDGTLTLGNMPHLADITTLATLLQELGVEIRLNGHAPGGGSLGRVMELTTKDESKTTAPYELVCKMRASIWVLGPLLAKRGHARVSLPGGCAIGTRPVDLHIKGLEALGADITLTEGYVEGHAPKGLRGARFTFPKVSVGATENLMMAATLAKGETVLENAAREPEVGDLARCLVAMGAKIDGIDTDTLVIEGVKHLHGAHHNIIADRIETGTYAIAAAITGGDILLTNTSLENIRALAEVLVRAGVEIGETEDGIRVARTGHLLGTDAMTEPFPGFPTDLQAQFMALMTVADGAAMITETIFENRFMHVPELGRLGADINVHQSSALVRGVKKLTGAQVMASDLRASASLVLAGLAAEGETTVNRIYHLDRGYERLEEKLTACGADIHRVRDSEGGDD